MGKENENENKKEKKHLSKKIWCLIILVVCAIALMIAMIYTGAWNPFKSRDLSATAKETYENNETIGKGFALSLQYNEEDMTDGSYLSIYGPKSGCPYGFGVEDYGEDGKNGVLIKKTTQDSGYYEKYGMAFDIYYMKNEEYALEKYNNFKAGVIYSAPYAKETVIDENTRVCYWIDETDNFPNYYILQETVVYDTWSDYLNWKKNQKIFDFLNIKYTIPNYEDVINSSK